MPTPDNLSAIFQRIINHQYTDTDLEILRQALTVNRIQNVVQIGKYTVSIGQGQDIRIGDQTIYQGADAETIRAVVRDLLKDVQTVNSSLVRFGIGASSVVLTVFCFALFHMINSISKSETLNFYFLFFWAVISAFGGGFIWSKFLNGTLGGTEFEPHNIKAMAWAISTNIPSSIILIFLNWRYGFSNYGNGQWILLNLIFLLGMSLGSLLFYDFPISGRKGFRNYIFSRSQLSLFQKEAWLVVIWSSIIVSFSFFPVTLLKTIGFSVPLWLGLLTFIKQFLICVIPTTLTVWIFILAYLSNSRDDSARGIVAGLVLRISLFFGMFIS